MQENQNGNAPEQNTMIKSRDSEIKKDGRINQSTRQSYSTDQIDKEFEELGRVSKDNDGKIIKDENEEKIKVRMESYFNLIKICGGWINLIGVNIVLAGFTYFKIMTDYTCG